MKADPTAKEIISFWRDAGPQKWFRKDDAFDAHIREGFEAAHHAAARSEYAAWEETADGALALLILLDQFPRNIYRGSGHSFATDGLARAIAASAVNRGFDQGVEKALRLFVYMPFEHSEHAADQSKSLKLFEALGDVEYLRFAKLHADIIERFGRFPHRNAMLGRMSTVDEKKFLDEGGFAG